MDILVPAAKDGSCFHVLEYTVVMRLRKVALVETLRVQQPPAEGNSEQTLDGQVLRVVAFKSAERS